jgi:hypothetical protein
VFIFRHLVMFGYELAPARMNGKSNFPVARRAGSDKIKMCTLALHQEHPRVRDDRYSRLPFTFCNGLPAPEKQPRRRASFNIPWAVLRVVIRTNNERMVGGRSLKHRWQCFGSNAGQRLNDSVLQI